MILPDVYSTPVTPYLPSTLCLTSVSFVLHDIHYAPPSLLAYSSSILSSYNLSAASSASVFVYEVVFVAVWAAPEIGTEKSVAGLGSILELDGFSPEPVAIGILIASGGQMI